jgi:hypothetical protein
MIIQPLRAALVRRVREKVERVHVVGLVCPELGLVADPDGGRAVRGDPFVQTAETG